MPETLLDRLLKLYPTAKRQNLKRMVEAGRVTINRRPARFLKTPVAETDKVVVSDAPAGRSDTTAPPGLVIVHEDADLLVADKPAGLLTSTVPREPRPTLLALVRDYVSASDPRARVGLIHRLDRDVSGLLVFSKNPAAYDSLKSQLFHRTMKRVYAAIVVGKPAQRTGHFDSRLVELPNGTVRVTRMPDAGERAVTDYQLVSQHGPLALLRLTLLTGRKHQIRVHLSQHKLPVLGDPLYAPEHPAPRLMLHATQLTLAHPRTAETVKFESALPPEMRELLKQQ